MSRILVITSCTSRKVPLPPGAKVPAQRLYTGDQHARLMAGVDTFRSSPLVRAEGHTLSVWIVSAGHGLVSEGEEIETYDVTFAGMGRRRLTDRSGELGIPTAIRSILSEPFDLGILLLGADYMRAAAFDRQVVTRGPTLAFASAETERLLADVPAVRTVHVGVEDTRRFAAGLVGLKGELARRLLAKLGLEPGEIGRVAEKDFDVLEWLTTFDSQPQLQLAA